MQPAPSAAPRSRSTAGTDSFVTHRVESVSCRLTLTAGTKIREPRLRALGLNSNRHFAPGTRPAAASVDRRTLLGDRREQVPSHELPGRSVDPSQPRLIELCRRRPGVEPQCPERLALIDVAHAGADALVEEQFSNGGSVRPAGASDHFIQIERIDQDIGPEVSDWEALVDHQLQ